MGEEDHGDKGTCPAHYMLLTLITGLKECLSGLPTVKGHSLRPILRSLEGAHSAQLTPKECGVMFPPLYGRVYTKITWNFSAWVIWLFSPMY